mmetsp:Transcript_31020/g.80495  ORF Transcript_31020/g.80495 Transcript_31020/m.80495 type:complete len:246 (-) Transcript_31020:216-953(-)
MLDPPCCQHTHERQGMRRRDWPPTVACIRYEATHGTRREDADVRIISGESAHAATGATDFRPPLHMSATARYPCCWASCDASCATTTRLSRFMLLLVAEKSAAGKAPTLLDMSPPSGALASCGKAPFFHAFLRAWALWMLCRSSSARSCSSATVAPMYGDGNALISQAGWVENSLPRRDMDMVERAAPDNPVVPADRFGREKESAVDPARVERNCRLSRHPVLAVPPRPRRLPRRGRVAVSTPLL